MLDTAVTALGENAEYAAKQFGYLAEALDKMRKARPV